MNGSIKLKLPPRARDLYYEFLFLFMIFSLPFTRFFYLYIYSLTFKLPELAGLLLIFITISRGKISGYVKDNPLSFPVAIFLEISVLSFIINFLNIDVNIPVRGGFEGARMPLPYAIVQFPWAIFSLLIAIVTERIITDFSKLRKVFNAIFLSAAVTCFCGLFEIARFYFLGKKVIRVVRLGNLVFPKMTSVEYESSMFGIYLVIVFFFVLADFFNSPLSSKRRAWLKALMILIGVSLLLTFSSLAWFSLLLGLLIFTFLCVKKGQLRLKSILVLAGKIVIIFLILCTIFVILFPQAFLYCKDAVFYTLRKVFTFENAAGGRRYFALGGLRAFLNNPWFGLGPAQLRFNMQRYVSDNMDNWLLVPASFNLYIDTLAEVGIIGFFAFLYIIYSIYTILIKSLNAAIDKRNSLLVIAAITTVSVIYFSMLGIGNFYRIIIWVVFGVALAIAHLAEGLLNEKES